MEETTEATTLVVEPVYEEQCRICQFSRTHIKVYNFLSKMILDGESYGHIEGSMQAYLNIYHPDVKSPVKKSIFNHVSNHLTPEVQHQIAMNKAKKNNVPPPAKDKPAKTIVKHVVKEREFDIEKFDEYKELCALYADLTAIFNKAFLQDNEQVDEEGMPVEWSATKMQNYISMMNTRKAVLTEISKMREGDKLVVTATKYAIKLLITNVVDRALEEFNALGEVLSKRATPDVVKLFEDITRDRFGRMLLEEAKNSLEQTKKEYKLPE